MKRMGYIRVSLGETRWEFGVTSEADFRAENGFDTRYHDSRTELMLPTVIT